jgi:hypothetical protein
VVSLEQPFAFLKCDIFLRQLKIMTATFMHLLKPLLKHFSKSSFGNNFEEKISCTFGGCR